MVTKTFNAMHSSSYKLAENVYIMGVVHVFLYANYGWAPKLSFLFNFLFNRFVTSKVQKDTYDKRKQKMATGGQTEHSPRGGGGGGVKP